MMVKADHSCNNRFPMRPELQNPPWVAPCASGGFDPARILAIGRVGNVGMFTDVLCQISV